MIFQSFLAHRCRGAGGIGVRHLLTCAIVVLLAAIAVGSAEGSVDPKSVPLPTLTLAQQVRRLTANEANRHYPVELKGVVLWADTTGFFLQDASGAIAVNTEPGPPSTVTTGQLVLLVGVSECPDFAPEIKSTGVTVLGSAHLPSPRHPTFEQMASTEEDSQWVEIEGIVHASTIDATATPALFVAVSGGEVVAHIPGLSEPAGTKLVDAKVGIRGNCGAFYNQRNQWLGVRLYVPSAEQLQVVEPPLSDPFSLSRQMITSLLNFHLADTGGHRVMIRGAVTAQRLGESLVVADETGEILARTTQPTAAQPGDRVEVLGFLGLGRYTYVLEDATFRVIGHRDALAVRPLTVKEALSGDYEAALVRIEGRLLGISRRGSDLILSMQSGAQTFEAEIPGKAANGIAVSLLENSKLRLTGVCLVEANDARVPLSFRILLRTAEDIVVTSRPSWWTLGRAAGMLGALGVAVLVALAWAWALRRRVFSQTGIIQTTLESTGDDILVVDEYGDILHSNQRFSRTWGLGSANLVGREAGTVLRAVASPVKDPETYLKRTDDIYRKPDSVSDDLVEFADGRVLERHSEPLEIRGRRAGRVWSFRNITERRRAEAELHSSRQMLKLVLDNIPNGSSGKTEVADTSAATRPSPRMRASPRPLP
jgi:PAS domain S-box-containing protein